MSGSFERRILQHLSTVDRSHDMFGNPSYRKDALLERFRCAGVLMLRGTFALVRYPLEFMAKSADGASKLIALNILTEFAPVAIAAAAGFSVGAVVGVATFSESLIEAPIQLVRPGKPDSKPWIQRKLENS